MVLSWRLKTVAVFFASGVVGCNEGDTRQQDATPSAKVEQKDGPSVAVEQPEDDHCDVTVSGPARVQVGETSKITVSMQAGGRYKFNQEAPFAVRVASDNLHPSKGRYTIDDASVLASEGVTMEIPFTSQTPGEHDLEVHTHFGVCSDADCALCRKRSELTTIVD